MLLGAGVLLLGGADAPPGGVTVLFVWLALYAASAVVEEGLCCAGAPPQPPLRPGANPFWDYMSRPMVRGDAACAPGSLAAWQPRMAVRALRPCSAAECCRARALVAHGAHRLPALLHLLEQHPHLRCAALRTAITARAGVATTYSLVLCPGAVVNAINRATHGDDRRRHALLVPITQRFACTVLWCCGYTVRVTCIAVILPHACALTTHASALH